MPWCVVWSIRAAVGMAADLVADSLADWVRACVAIQEYKLTRERRDFSSLCSGGVLEDEVTCQLLWLGVDGPAAVVVGVEVRALVAARRQDEGSGHSW